MALTKVSTGMIEAGASSVDLNIDEGTLFIDASNNRVGVANVSPATALDVSGTITGTLFSGSGASLTNIPNVALDNSSITINSYSTALGGTVTLSTSDIGEGTNLYYTDARWDTKFAAATTTGLSEGTNLYYTDARARSSISITDSGGDGSLAYDNGTGVITYTGPSAAEVRAHISAGTGVDFSSGVISIGQSVGTSDTVTFNNLTVSTTATIPYDNTISGLTATNIQSAITELNTLVGGGNIGSQANYEIYEFTATGNQTTFDISTQGSPAPSYDPGYIQVFMNGVLLSETDYTAVDGSNVVLSTGATAGQLISIITLDSFNIQELLRVTSIDASASTDSIAIDANDKVTLSSLAVDTDTLIVNATNNRVGIGTTDPGAKLEISGKDDASGSDLLRLQFDNSPADSGITFTDIETVVKNRISMDSGNTNDLRISAGTKIHLYGGTTNGTTSPHLTVSNDGNVGIGTSIPFAKLSVTGTSASANDAGIFQITDGTGANTDTKIVMGVVDSDYGWIQSAKPGTNVYDLVLNPNGGNVGIGTTSPQVGLHVGSGTQAIAALNGIGIANGSNAYSFFQASDGTKQYIAGVDHNITYTKSGTLSNHDHAIVTNNTNRIYIKNTGNVGIGTNSPTQKLDVAGTALVENAKLKAIAESNTDTAVDVFVYDTRKDSDGGAWRKRTQNTSWYNETLNTSTRGSRKEFPCVAVIVAENNKVTIYDGDDPLMPMWMVFQRESVTGLENMTLLYAQGEGVYAINGMICSVGAAGWNDGLTQIKFITDDATWRNINNVAYWETNIVNRNLAGGYPQFYQDSSKFIVSPSVRDIAMTVLPNAPIDAATGLPVPTIAVATDGGVSVIKDDGTVVDITAGAGALYDGVSWIDITENNYLIFEQDNSDRSVFHIPIPSSDRTTETNDGNITDKVILKWYSNGAHEPYPVFNGAGVISGIGMKGNNQALRGSNNELTLLEPDISSPEQGKVAYITSNHNTGWMHGDIKLATLSDTEDTDVTGSELVTNGTFDSSSNWTLSTGWSISGGKLRKTDSSNTSALQTINTVTGKTYVISVTVDTGAAGTYIFADVDYSGDILSSAGVYSRTFTATSTTTVVGITGVPGTGLIADNFSVRLAEADRSMNGKGLQVFGTVTKTAVATGAELVAYSNFGVSTYLDQPYNSELDFGTGDFCYNFWEKHADSSSNQWAISRDRNSTVGWILIGLVAGKMRFEIAGSVFADIVDPVNVWNCWHFIRKSGVCFVYLNGVQQASFVSSDNLDASARQAPLRLGRIDYTTQTDSWHGSLALVRVSATAPTADQIKKIYEDEKFLFQENAQATLYGSSDAVTALAYDDDTELLHVGTPAGRSEFHGLRRVNNTTDAVSEAISASNGFIVED